jgi:hypothetical protein
MSFGDSFRRQLDRKERGKREFMAMVEQHQKAWGNETYKGKPTLQQIMDARIVVFWRPTNEAMYLTITIHNDLSEINDYLVALILHTKTRLPVLRLDSVFVGKIPRKVKSVTINWGDAV